MVLFMCHIISICFSIEKNMNVCLQSLVYSLLFIILFQIFVLSHVSHKKVNIL